MKKNYIVPSLKDIMCLDKWILIRVIDALRVLIKLSRRKKEIDSVWGDQGRLSRMWYLVWIYLVQVKKFLLKL